MNPWRGCALLVLCLAIGPAQRARAADPPTPELAAAAALVEGARPEEALTLLDKLIESRPKSPKALLLRSTAHFMLGNMAEGERDLDRSIGLDPEDRQAWLNRAALEVADQSYDKALAAFRRAENLDKSASENSLNIGAVLLLLDRFDQAQDRFKDYLARNPGDPKARYLVASNYASKGLVQPVLANLSRAIALDERFRRDARADPNFAPVSGSAEFQRLLDTDTFRHPAGSAIATNTYEDQPYLGGRSAVLDAVIGSLQLAGRAFDPQVEVTPQWALIWSDLRIKVSDNGAGGTELEMSAPPGRFRPAQWEALTEELLRGVKVQLHTRTRRPGAL